MFSVFEAIRNEPYRQTDLESQRAPPSEDAFRDYEDDPEQMFFEGANDDTISLTHLSPEARASMQSSPTLDRIRPKWLDDTRNRRIEEDDDVPESLLLDPNTHGPGSRASSRPAKDTVEARAEAQWRATQEQHGLHGMAKARPPALSATHPGNRCSNGPVASESASRSNVAVHERKQSRCFSTRSVPVLHRTWHLVDSAVRSYQSAD